MDFLVFSAWADDVWEAADAFAFAAVDFTASDLLVVVVVAVLMTIVVFDFPQLALSVPCSQQKTVQKSTVCENMFV
ncbi:MAG: hypothetical protein ACPIG6_05285 [Akkermansiaceae bacterium]